jgi:putative membrane protein
MKTLRSALIITILAAVFGLYPSARAVAQPWGGSGSCIFGSWMTGGWGGGWFGMIFMILFWILIVAGAVALIRWIVRGTGGTSKLNTGGWQPGPNALAILENRYARGEIDRDEFEAKKQDILQ